MEAGGPTTFSLCVLCNTCAFEDSSRFRPTSHRVNVPSFSRRELSPTNMKSNFYENKIWERVWASRTLEFSIILWTIVFFFFLISREREREREREFLYRSCSRYSFQSTYLNIITLDESILSLKIGQFRAVLSRKKRVHLSLNYIFPV